MVAWHWKLPQQVTRQARGAFLLQGLGKESPGIPPAPTHLLGAVRAAHLVINVRNHLQRATQRGQGLPEGKVAISD